MSDETTLGIMDKNIGEQLNKAYEAYRQACMDRDHAVKELQQKVCVRFQIVSLKPSFPRRIVVPVDFSFTLAIGTSVHLLKLEVAIMKPGQYTAK